MYNTIYPVNIREELEPFQFHKQRIRGSELSCCSPFREERRPSFSINLKTGLWIDRGSDDDAWKKGNLIRLLAYLNKQPIAEVREYLQSKYGAVTAPVDELSLSIQLDEEKGEAAGSLAVTVLDAYLDENEYLESRGISKSTQDRFCVGYSEKQNAVSFPWFDAHGNLANVKFRKVDNKQFWYVSEGKAIKNHLYCLHTIFRHNIEKVYICEAEIDALTLWNHDKPAVAIGGSHLSLAQRQLLLSSPIKSLVIAVDADHAGETLKRQIKDELLGLIDLYELEFPAGVKDVNEMSVEQLKSCREKPIRISIF